MKKKFLFLAVICYAKLCIGQTEINDSLFSLLATAKNDTSKVNLLHEIARSVRYANNDTALYFVRQALALSTKLNYKMGIGTSKVAIGGLYADAGRCDEGAKSALEGLDIFNGLLKTAASADKQIILRKIASAYNVTGHNKISQGNYTEGLKYSLLALKVREDIGDSEGVATTQYNIGNIYITQHNHADALKYYNACMKWTLETGIKKDIAYMYGAIGYVYIDQGNYSEALKKYSMALKLGEESKDPWTLAELYINVGTIHEKLGNYSEALKYDFAALKRYLEIGINQQTALAYHNIGSVYTKQHKFREASEYLGKALALSKSIRFLEYMKMSYESMAILDSAKGDYRNALTNYKLSVIYRDSLHNEENTKKIVQHQMQYEFDKKESLGKAEQDKKDALAGEELKKQRIIRNTIGGGLAALSLFSIVVLRQRNRIGREKKRSEELLLNILPEETAEELKSKGSADAKSFDEVTVMFTDFKNFTKASEQMSAADLVKTIHHCYSGFDRIIARHNLEKIKTIGDSYMCAGGLPVANKTNAEDTVHAALEICAFMEEEMKQRVAHNETYFEIRIGVHTGPVVAGIVGIKKFAYDIWGDTVNIASRMESAGEAGKVNISGSTYALVKEKFECIHRGKIQAKNKGEIDMYFVSRSLHLR